MSVPLTEAELAELEAIAGKATPGPWVRGGFPDEHAYKGVVPGGTARVGPAIAWGDDQTFIAASREAMPKLIAEVRRLQQLLIDTDLYRRPV